MVPESVFKGVGEQFGEDQPKGQRMSVAEEKTRRNVLDDVRSNLLLISSSCPTLIRGNASAGEFLH